MRRFLLSLFAASAMLSPMAFAQGVPHLLAAPIEDDGYSLAEAPNDHIIGADDAPNTLIIYASVTCSHCSSWFTKEWDLLKSELIDTGELRVVFREFITAPPQIAASGFTIANCTKADNYIDVIQHQMINQATIFADLKASKGLAAYASTLEIAGLTEADIPACFEDKAHSERLQISMKRAQNSGLKGVPAFILNGELYSGSATAKELTETFAGGVSKP